MDSQNKLQKYKKVHKYKCIEVLIFVLMYFLFGLSIGTSMQNLESVAQKIAELLH